MKETLSSLGSTLADQKRQKALETLLEQGTLIGNIHTAITPGLKGWIDGLVANESPVSLSVLSSPPPILQAIHSPQIAATAFQQPVDWHWARYWTTPTPERVIAERGPALCPAPCWEVVEHGPAPWSAPWRVIAEHGPVLWPTPWGVAEHGPAPWPTPWGVVEHGPAPWPAPFLLLPSL